MWGSWKSPPHISLLLWARHLTSLLPFLHLWTSVTTVLQDNYKARFGVFFSQMLWTWKAQDESPNAFFLILLRTPSKSLHEREIAFSHQLNTSLVHSQESSRAANKAAEVCSHPSTSPFISPVLIHSCHHPCASPSRQDNCQTTTKFVMTTESIKVAAVSWRMPLDD